jgi:hypothetical protein
MKDKDIGDCISRDMHCDYCRHACVFCRESRKKMATRITNLITQREAELMIQTHERKIMDEFMKTKQYLIQTLLLLDEKFAELQKRNKCKTSSK